MKKKEAKFSQKRGLVQTNASKHSSAVSQVAIQIPNDGPLFHLLKDDDKHNLAADDDETGGKKLETNTNTANDDGLSAAVGLFATLEAKVYPTTTSSDGGRDDDKDIDVSNTVEENASEGSEQTQTVECVVIRMLQELKGATSTKRQLQAVQAFRSSLLYLNKQDYSYTASEALLARRGVYRLLLELVISSRSPLALKRGATTCLTALCADADTPSKEETCESLVSVDMSVLESLFKQGAWSDTVETMHEAMAYEPIRNIVLRSGRLLECSLSMLDQCMSQSLTVLFPRTENGDGSFKKDDNDITVTDMLEKYSFSTAQVHDKEQETNASFQSVVEAANAVQYGQAVVKTLRTILLPLSNNLMMQAEPEHTLQDGEDIGRNRTLLLLRKLEHSPLTALLQCRATTADGLSVVGVARAQIQYLQWAHYTSPPLSVAAMRELVSGMIANVNGSPSISVDEPECLSHLAIVRGLLAVFPDNVCLSKATDCGNTSNVSLLCGEFAQYFFTQCQQTSAAVRLSAMRGWDGWLSRATSILNGGERERSVFRQEMIELNLLEAIIDMIMDTWSKPLSRQIRAIVPVVFRSLVTFVEAMSDEQNDNPSIALGKGTHGSDNLAMKSLTKRILSQPQHRKGRHEAILLLLPIIGANTLLDMDGHETFFLTMIQEIGDMGNNASVIAQLLGKLLATLLSECTGTYGNGTGTAHGNVEKWIDSFLDHLSSALLSQSRLRRKRVSDFCLPVVASLPANQASSMFLILIVKLGDKTKALVSEIIFPVSDIYASLNLGTRVDSIAPSDIYVWSLLECTRCASKQKLLTKSPDLRLLIVEKFPLCELQASLVHAQSSLLMSSFLALESIAPCYIVEGTSNALDLEVKLWRTALPYVVKSCDRGSTTQLMRCLTRLLVRVSSSPNVKDDASASSESDAADLFQSFVIKFVIKDLACSQCAYPGSVLDREMFAIGLLRTVFTFAVDSGDSFKRKDPKKGMKTAGISLKANAQNGDKVVELLASDDVVLPLFALLHSQWDATRVAAYELLRDIFRFVLRSKISAKCILQNSRHRLSLEASALEMTSSPRQRESDTGARLLALLYLTEQSEMWFLYIETLIQSLGARLDKLEPIVADMGTAALEFSDKPPLPHGLVTSVRLVIEEVKHTLLLEQEGSHNDVKSRCSLVFHEAGKICCRSFLLSLDVVAEAKICGGAEQGAKVVQPNNSGVITLNVNAIVPVLASPSPNDQEVEVEKRKERAMYVMQQVVMGSWLLLKEACAGISSIVTLFPGIPPFDLVDKIGKHLLDGLTLLKHQGGVFAAHKALQCLAEMCYTSFASTPAIQSLPATWSSYFTNVIQERICNSTLRRSTGYALGVLSMLRAEPSPKVICPAVLASLLRMSLPMGPTIDRVFKALKCSPDFSCIVKDLAFVPTSEYQPITRVHALNILRAAVLDAPLAEDVRPFMGDAIVSSILGYDDEDWAVRNSATMVFAASIVRVVDADKNASETTKSGGVKKQMAPVSLGQLCMAYPLLATFLPAFLGKQLAHETAGDGNDSALGHNAVFPILMLLARLQPVARNADSASEIQIANSFLAPVLMCIGHPNHKVRCMAARALSVVHVHTASVDKDISSLLSSSLDCSDMNKVHGSLLAILELTHSSTTFAHCVKTSWWTTLTSLASWGEGSCTCAPSCAVVALEILTIHNDNPVAASEIERAARISFLMASRMQKTAVDVVGLSLLVRTSAKILTNIAKFNIFKPAQDGRSAACYVGRLQSLLGHPSFDARLSSTKEFKKGLNQQILDFVFRSSTESDDVADDDSQMRKVNSQLDDVQIMKEMAQCLWKSLAAEMYRSDRKDAFGPHPPTLRRLSRCLIEILHGLEVSGVQYFPDNDLATVMETTADIAKIGMLNILIEDTEIMSHQNSAIGIDLSGNAVELMAYSIKGLKDAGRKSSWAGLFAKAVQKLSHPMAQASVRYSAAAAVSISHLLFGPSLELSDRRRILGSMLQLLQDDDGDIRLAAALPLVEINASSTEEQKISLQCSPLKRLELGFQWYCNKYGHDELLLALQGKILEACETLEEHLASSRKVEGREGRELKIFVEDDPNPLEEELYTVQLACKKWINLDVGSLTNGSELILSRCSSLLEFLQATGSYELDDDITRSASVFPAAISVLLGSICVVYHSKHQAADDSSNAACRIVNDANSVLSHLIGADFACGTVTVHPLLLRCVEALASVSPGSTASKHDLIRCCFLTSSVTEQNSEIN